MASKLVKQFKKKKENGLRLIHGVHLPTSFSMIGNYDHGQKHLINFTCLYCSFPNEILKYCQLVATIVLQFQICFFLNQNYCLGCSWLERPFSSIAGLDINSPMLAKTSGAEKKSNWHYGELMAVGLMALLSLWVRGPGVDSRRCPFCCGIWCEQSFLIYK